jgi:tetratricopeptide (TPR) repeat protein
MGTMNRWRWARVARVAMGAFLAAGVCGVGSGAAWGAAGEENPSADALLAARLGELAHSTLHSSVVLPPTWLQAIDLLLAAQRLDPKDSRYPRLLIDAQLEARNREGAEGALKAYRALEPNDRVAQVQLIDLYVSQIETADGKLRYLRKLVDDQSIPEAVRSHVAVSAAVVLFARAQEEEARGMLAQAVKLNPLNMEALRLRYQRLENPTAGKRVGLLLEMLRSNPGQPEVIQTLARELGSAGLTDLALEWYARGVSLLRDQGQALSQEVAREYAIELSIGDQPQLAMALAKQLLQADPADLDALMVSALAAAQNGDADAQRSVEGQLIHALLNQAARAKQAAGDKGATTQPIDSPAPANLPDFSADVGKIKAAAPAVRTAYISALTDLAWTELYFKNDAAAAGKVIDTIRQLVPADNITLTRLEGWEFLVAGKPGEAKVKLTAVADRDALAALGLARLEKDKAKAAAQAGRLLDENPTGLLAAFLWNGGRELGARRGSSERGDELRRQVQSFPRDWLGVLDQPQKYYALRFEPLKVGHGFGQPMWARVTVQNIGDRPLTLGDDGVIHRDLWVDAQLRGLNQQPIPAIAYERLGGYLVLRPGQSTSRLVRIDQGVLDNFLKSNPRVAIQLSASVITNPVLTSSGSNPGPAGQRTQLSRLIQRNGFPLDDASAKQAIYAKVTSGTASEQFQNLGLLAAYTQIFRSEKAPDALKPLAAEFVDVIRKAGNDSDPSLGAWASYLHARLLDEPHRLVAVRQMAADPAWQKRLLALVAVQSLPVKAQLDIATGLAAKDADDVVRSYAGAVQQLAQLPTSRPATQEGTTAPARP